MIQRLAAIHVDALPIPLLDKEGSGVVDESTDPETDHPQAPPRPGRGVSFYAERGFNADP